jgi:mycothiol synthase
MRQTRDDRPIASWTARQDPGNTRKQQEIVGGVSGEGLPRGEAKSLEGGDALATADLRPYQGGDEAGILDLWERTCPRDVITPASFYRKTLLDPNFDPAGCWVAVDPADSGRIVGYVQAVDRKVPLGAEWDADTGWVTALMVDPAYQRRGIGQALLEQALAYLKGHGRRYAEFSPYAPHYVLPGLDREAYPAGAAFFQKLGWRVLYSPVAMDRLLYDFTIPPDVVALETQLAAEGVVEPVRPAYYTRLLAFTDREFYADWTRALREALAAGLPSSRLYICREGDTILGFAMFGGYDESLERFGPFGVAESQRGRGLGKVLLYRVLAEMKREGCHSAWFLWTGERSPAGHLYHRAGFTTTRRFDILRTVLE